MVFKVFRLYIYNLSCDCWNFNRGRRKNLRELKYLKEERKSDSNVLSRVKGRSLCPQDKLAPVVPPAEVANVPKDETASIPAGQHLHCGNLGERNEAGRSRREWNAVCELTYAVVWNGMHASYL